MEDALAYAKEYLTVPLLGVLLLLSLASFVVAVVAAIRRRWKPAAIWGAVCFVCAILAVLLVFLIMGVGLGSMT